MVRYLKPGLWALVAFLSFNLMTGTTVKAQVFGPETFRLTNGMDVVVLPDHRSPVVHHMVWYKVGSADEPKGKSGIAHLLEHLMFKGTPTMPPGAFSKTVARNGGNDNAFTSDNYTAYFQTIAREHLPMVMRMEADRMANLTLSESDFVTELSVVREERRSRTDTEPSALLREQMHKQLWGNYPYANPVIGWESELSALTRQDALDFYERFYTPPNAILIVSGDITADQLKPLAEETYGVIPGRPAPDRQRPTTLESPEEDVVVLRHSQVHQPSVLRKYVAPSLSADPEDRAYALKVVSELLGGGSTSRLYQSLVVDQELAVGAGCWYEADALDYGVFTVYASPREGVDTETLVAALDREFARLLKDGLSVGELDRTKHRLTANLVYARDSLSIGARTLGAAMTTGSNSDDVESWPERIRAVTSDQVISTARTVLGENPHVVTGILLPQEGARP